MVEGDLDRAVERADAGESKIVDLEEELRQIGKLVCIYKRVISLALQVLIKRLN